MTASGVPGTRKLRRGTSKAIGLLCPLQPLHLVRTVGYSYMHMGKIGVSVVEIKDSKKLSNYMLENVRRMMYSSQESE